MPGRSIGTEGSGGSGTATPEPGTAGSGTAASGTAGSGTAASGTAGSRRRARLRSAGRVARAWSEAVRSRIASLVWLLAVSAAVILASGALLVALGANAANALVSWVLDAASAIDGPFWKVFEFTEQDAAGRVQPDETKEALANWGLAAASYLAVGRILDRVIRP